LLTPFTTWYRLSMTGTLNYDRVEGLEYWERFRQEIIKRYANKEEERKALASMHSHKYEGDICTFLLRQENDDMMAKVTGIAFREIIKRALPIDILRRLLVKEIDDEREWLNAVQYHGMEEEGFLRRGPGKTGSDSSLGKRERPKEKDSANKKPKKDKPWKTKKEKGNSGTKGSMGSKSEKKGSGATKLHTDWEQAHDGIPQEVVDKRRADKG